MLGLNSTMIGTNQFDALTAFYEKLIGKSPDMVEQASGFMGWQLGHNYLGILKHSGMNGSTKDPGRMMLNFETGNVQAEFERIKGLGAAVIQAPYKMGEAWIATLADPDGNYFQLMTPMG